MSCLHYQEDTLYIDDVNLQSIVERHQTPTYVYSRAKIEANWNTFNNAFNTIPHRICYAVKANGNIAILNLLAKLGSSFDIVSLGELERVLAAGGQPDKIIFSGVGKKTDEIKSAIEYGIYCFNIESEAELERINTIASSLSVKVGIALRVNPNIDADTHAYISTGLKENKFGISIARILPLCLQITSQSQLTLLGIDCHIGSQITTLPPFESALDTLLTLYKQLQSKNITLKHINMGGGLGITYRDEKPPSIDEYANAIQRKLTDTSLELIIEPGRAIIANAGVLLTTIEYIKHTDHRNFAIVDAGMNDLLRPALYDAWQPILPVQRREEKPTLYDIAGPVCESADFLGKHRELCIETGDVLAVDCAGAYGFSMSSNYNARCRPAEILVDGSNMHLIRRREKITDLFDSEEIPNGL